MICSVIATIQDARTVQQVPLSRHVDPRHCNRAYQAAQRLHRLGGYAPEVIEITQVQSGGPAPATPERTDTPLGVGHNDALTREGTGL